MRVRLPLALRMDAGTAVLEVGNQFADAPVGPDRQGHGVGVSVVHRRQSSSRRVHGYVGCPATGGTGSIAFAQGPGRLINLKRRDDALRGTSGTGLATHGVERPALRMDREKARPPDLRRLPRCAERTRPVVERGHVDVVRSRAEIHPVLH